LSLRNQDAQVGVVMARVKALNRMTLLALPTSVRLV
ncbi:IS5/IS1182 family transposase, partial [Salmonella enterica subsp. enterica serovar Infantis]